MTAGQILRLAWQSVVAPREVADGLLEARPSHEAIILGFALVIVLNTLFFSLSLLTDGSATSSDFMAPVVGNPVVFMFTLAGSLAVTAIALTWAGRMMGGKAELREMTLLLVWLQGLRVLVQGALVVLVFISPQLSWLVVLLAAGAALWILINFVNAAHRFDDLGRAGLVLFVALVGSVLGLAMFLSLIGVSAMGMGANV